MKFDDQYFYVRSLLRLSNQSGECRGKPYIFWIVTFNIISNFINDFLQLLSAR